MRKRENCKLVFNIVPVTSLSKVALFGTYEALANLSLATESVAV